MHTRIGSLLIMLALAGWASNVSAVPITDLINVDGKEWSQPDLFVDETHKIGTACPARICGNTTVNGYDMLGWTWAANDEVNALFNYYIGSTLLGPAPDTYDETDSVWAPAFFADGWRPTYAEGRFGALISGITQSSGYMASLWDQTQGRTDSASITDELYSPLPPFGGWFYREATSVPTPPSLLLLGFGLVVFGYRRGNSDSGRNA